MTEELKNIIKNKIWKSDKAIYPFKPKNIDYITHEEAIFIMGQITTRDLS